MHGIQQIQKTELDYDIRKNQIRWNGIHFYADLWFGDIQK